MSPSNGRWLIMVLACGLLPFLNGCSRKIVRTQAQMDAQNRLFRSRAMPPSLLKILEPLDEALSKCTADTIATYAFRKQRAFADNEPPLKADQGCDSGSSWEICRRGDEPPYRTNEYGDKVPDHWKLFLENIGLDLRKPNPHRKAWERGIKTGVLLPDGQDNSVFEGWIGVATEPAFDSFSVWYRKSLSTSERRALRKEGASNSGRRMLKAYIAAHGLLPPIMDCVDPNPQSDSGDPVVGFGECLTADQPVLDTAEELRVLVGSMEAKDWRTASLSGITNGITKLTDLLEKFEEKYTARLNVCAIEATKQAKIINEKHAAFESRFSEVANLSCGRVSERPTLCFEGQASNAFRLSACDTGSAEAEKSDSNDRQSETSWRFAAGKVAARLLKTLKRTSDQRFAKAASAIGIASIEYPQPRIDGDAFDKCPIPIDSNVQPKFSEAIGGAGRLLNALADAEDAQLRRALDEMDSRYQDCAYRWRAETPLSSFCRLKKDLDGRLHKQSATRLINKCEPFVTYYDANHKDIVDHPRCLTASSYLGRKCEKLSTYQANVQGIRDEVAKLKTVLPELIDRQQGLANGHRFDSENQRLLKKCRSAVLVLKRKYSPWSKCVKAVFSSRKARRYREQDGEMMAETTNAEMHHRILVRAAEKCARQHGITAMVDNGFKKCKSAVQVNQLSMKEALEHSSPFMPELSSAEVLAISGEREPYFGYGLSGARVPRSFRPGACYQKIYIGSTVLHRIATDFWIKDKFHDVKYVPTPPFFEDP